MALREAIIAALIGAPIYDWVIVNGAAQKMTSFDYRYWPLTRVRLASVALLSVGAFITFFITDPPEDRLWPMLPVFTTMALHCWVAIADIRRQRRL
ncbi:hypothetical protein [Sphingobium sp.]|uniref:hypothetical protein n=1 Tax=Sphingobium sp. TaxID=1912891 RepID=UPI002BCB7E39|nr:hypothetical protein [Sphingobium sp.]HUD94120.1 hypothetical protein [Sphingobium sp.]